MFRQQTHVDILFSRIACHGADPFFKSVRKDTSEGLTLDITTYSQFGKDINTLSAHLKDEFQRDGVKDGAVVGVALNGLTYSDIVHFYAVARAGYVPHLLSTYLTDPATVLALLSRTGTQAFIHEPGFSLGTGHKIIIYLPTDFSALGPPKNIVHSNQVYNPEGVAFILYTSGSTGDMPKAVPCTHKWFESVYNSWESVWNPAESGGTQDVFNIPGSFSNPTGLHVLLMGIYFGGAFVQGTTPFFSSDELLLLASKGGLNRFNTFAPFLCLHIQAAQQQLQVKDERVYNILLNMRSIVYGGMPMIPTFENWAFEHRLPIMNALGTTEAGPLLRCDLGDHPQHLRPFSGLALEFIPQPLDSTPEEGLFKIAILPTSPNIPDISLRNADGNFYTGDIFSKNEDGSWSHKGRDDDWIKIAAAKLVDTKAIEDFVRVHCSDLVAELVVVGNGRPSLAILAEPVKPDNGQAVKETIEKRMATFNERRYVWERISSDKIILVGRGTLPRTVMKGNIRRKAAEVRFEKELDETFA